MGPDAVAILLGAKLVTRSRDTEFPFRQDSDFWYLTGFDHPGAAAVLRTDGGPAYTLFVEPRDRALETWTGYRPGVEGAVARLRRRRGAPERRSCSRSSPSCCARRAADLPRARARRRARRAARRRRSRRCACARARASSPPTRSSTRARSSHEMRLFKEPRRARSDAARRRRSAREAHARGRAARAAAALSSTSSRPRSTTRFRRRGARGPAYTTIVGGGRNATVLHYVRNDQKLARTSSC